MKTLITILIVTSFLQTTILPIDLVLLILICRSYIKSEKANLYLGFAFGLLVAHLNLTGLGFQSLIYLFSIEVTQMLSKLRLAGNPLLIVPICFVFLSLAALAGSYLYHNSSWEFTKIIFVSILSLPIFYMLKLWEERFIVRKEIKLRV